MSAAARRLTGYTDTLSAPPGGAVQCKVSSPDGAYRAELVRLRHGDANPEGPGHLEQVITEVPTLELAGREQHVIPGSYVRVERIPGPRLTAGYTLSTWIWPRVIGTASHPATVDQGIISLHGGRGGPSAALVVDPSGRLAFRAFSASADHADHADDADNRPASIVVGPSLARHEWQFVAVSVDPAAAAVSLAVTSSRGVAAVVTGTIEQPDALVADAVDLLLIGAATTAGRPTDAQPRGPQSFNGKLDAPTVTAGALDLTTSAAGLADGVRIGELLCAWELGPYPALTIRDSGPLGLHGTPVNAPDTGVTGHSWTAAEVDFRNAPEQYRALDFHADAIGDAEWDTDFTFGIPPTLPSGVYAAKLTSATETDYLPFVVRPRPTAPRPRVLVLLPTLTYIAYANERIRSRKPLPGDQSLSAIDRQLDEHPEYGVSCYDSHSDGGRCHFSSRLRPVLNLRPDFRFWRTLGPAHFSADLYLIDWLTHEGVEFDVITDEDLHHQGPAALDGYRVLITGSHPEYITAAMDAAVGSFCDDGGRLMYLGGNGWWWVTGIDPLRPGVVEVRRREWDSPPGEQHLSSTGERGGIWPYRGRSTAARLGVTTIGMGFTPPSAGYLRTEASHDPRVAFMFDGIGDEEVLGTFGLVLGGGAAGHEIDIADVDRGTPQHALVVASSQSFTSETYAVTVERDQPMPPIPPSEDPLLRSDVTFFEVGSGGAVFSVGSINWMSSLSHARYDNNISRITGNVLRRFTSDEPFVHP